jgi:hypothetical protein
MTIFSHIEHISHKYPMKVKFPHKLSYFHTLSIFYTQSFCYFLLRSWFFEILNFFMVVVAQVQSFVGRWYSWLDHRGDKRRNLIKLIKLFLINDILDFDDSLFSRYNLLKSFVYCIWNIEHLSSIFC